MMKPLWVFLLALTCFEAQAQEARIAALERKIASLEDQVTSLSKITHPAVELNPSEPGTYQRLDMDLGPVLMTIDTVAPYLDGLKISLRLGNLLNADLGGLKFKALWGPRVLTEKNAHIQAFDTTKVFQRGVWTTFELILPSTLAADFGSFSMLEAEATVVFMKTAKKPEVP